MHKHNKMDDSIVAMALITIGAFFVFGQVFNFSIIGLLWPLFVIVPGVFMIMTAKNANLTRKKDQMCRTWLFIPGMITAGTGAILLYQNLTGQWISWAYAWTLYGAFIGIAFLQISEQLFDERHTLHEVGKHMTRWSLISFVALGSFVELINRDGSERQLLMALVLIGVGVYFLTRDDEDAPQLKDKRKNSVAGGDKGEIYYPYESLSPQPESSPSNDDKIALL